MSGILGIGGGGDTEFYPYTLDQSVRFNDGDAPRLQRTPSSTGSNTDWTISFWIKRCTLGTTQDVIDVGATGDTNSDTIQFQTDDTIRIQNNGTGILHTNYKFRDVSAWYNIVVKSDADNGTSANKLKIYINGVDQDDSANGGAGFSTDTRSSLSSWSEIGSTDPMQIGARIWNNGNNLDAYLAEFNYLDGVTVDASYFGETKNGIWIPKQYTGSYGTNGFRLTFEDDTTVEGFNTVLYDGNGATKSVGGVGFEPDFVWIKARDASYSHGIFDSVRGATKKISSDLTNAETTDASTLQSFDSDGFTMGSNAGTNDSGKDYVAWAWDAGTGSAASNTDGSITSTVKANAAYGFSIVTYTGNGTAGATIGHGLGNAPSMVIVKNRTSGYSYGWNVYHAALGATKGLNLDTTGAESTLTGLWNDTAPTSSVFSVGSIVSNNRSGNEFVAYCFAEISGYSKFGSFTGTGASGNTVSCGFRPAFLMVKRTDSTQSWLIVDNTREPNDSAAKTLELSPNITDVEPTYGSGDVATFTSTGFELAVGNVNLSGGEYIFMAFADTREYAFWTDQSGNNNDFQHTNLEHMDVVPDTPTSNFPTMNKLWQSKGTWTTAEGNLQNTWAANDYQSGIATMGLPATGKWYWEIYLKSRTYTNWLYWNLVIADYVEGNGNNGNSAAQWSNHYFSMSAERSDTGYLVVSSGSTNSIASSGIYDTGDVIQVAFDADNKRLYLGDSGTWFLSADPGAESGDSTAVWYNWSDDAQGKLFPALNVNYFTYVDVHNFGQDSTFAGNLAYGGNADANGIGDFKYTVPSGYLALCAANLPAPGINPNAGQTPDEYFNTVLYTGDGTDDRGVTGVGFQPDFVWIKARSAAADNVLYDIVRGAFNQLKSNDSGAETNDSTFLNSFDADGFTVDNIANTNTSSRTYASWNWKSGGTAVSNTDGSITSSVSASPESGFSIVTYTGTGATSSGVTIGHGLGATPEMIIGKRRDSTDNWSTWHKDLGGNYGIWLDLTNARNSAMWDGYTNFSSTVFSPPDLTYGNVSGATYVNYLFTSIDGYSKVGSYTGNGLSDGSFIYTGFRPAWLMVKRTDVANSWYIVDTVRTPNINAGNDDLLYPNLNNAEGSTNDFFDVFSNGFKLPSTSPAVNASGGTYIYLAFAEQPFKYANAR